MNFPIKLNNFNIEKIENGSFAVNNYLIYSSSTNKAILIDAGEETDFLLSEINKKKLTLDYIINTHGHSDHISGNSEILEKTGAKLIVHPEAVPALIEPVRNLSGFLGSNITSPEADILLTNNEIFEWESLKFTALHCPGHSPGGMALLVENILFSGDVLFRDSIGRTDLPFADHNLLISCIREKIFTLPDETIVLPGHGPETTVGYEKVNNPYVSSE